MDLDLIDTDLVVELVETVQFSLDMSSPAKIDNRKNDILILGKGPTQGLEHHWLQKKCTQLISLEIKKNILSLKQTVYLLMAQKFNSKQKILKL